MHTVRIGVSRICSLGIRMLDQPYMTDLIEANSMGHEPDLIDIYSARWGQEKVDILFRQVPHVLRV